MKRQYSTTRTHARSGLAPLELVLSLPIMLFVMGLMIVFGTAGAWKARAHANARQAVWRTIWPRTGDNDANPRGWPTSADMRVEDPDTSYVDDDPYAPFAVVRGPRLVDPDSGNTIPVKEDLLAIPDGMKQGVSHIRRAFPVMANMPPRQIDMTRKHPILDDRWQFQNMKIPNNGTRRILFLYPVDLTTQMPQEIQRYTDAATQIVNLMSNAPTSVLLTLDRDDELPNPVPSGLPYAPPYGLGRRRDYHLPGNGNVRRRLLNPERVCSKDPAEIRTQLVDDLILEIQGRPQPGGLNNAGVPGRLTRDYLDMYERHLAFIERLEDMLKDPATPPVVRQQITSSMPLMQQNKRNLEMWTDQLQSFSTYLMQ